MTTKTVRGTEAESIAFIVDRAVGLNTGSASASADYICLYHGNAELLTESLAVIQQASAAILDALFAEEAEPFAKAS
jgi:hypothetical protein